MIEVEAAHSYRGSVNPSGETGFFGRRRHLVTGYEDREHDQEEIEITPGLHPEQSWSSLQVLISLSVVEYFLLNNKSKSTENSYERIL